MPDSSDSTDEPSWKRLLPDVTFEQRAPSAGGRRPLELAQTRAVLEKAGLPEWAESASRLGPLTLVVNDGHRMTDTRSFLEAALPMIDATLARDVAVRALVAAGTHRSSAEERSAHEERVFGDLRARIDEVVWHDARDEAGLREIGGVRFHRWMAEGRSFLACGSSEPHYFAGVTGAHKTLTVGVMAADSIEANHSLAMRPEATGLALDGNPVHAGIARALDGLSRSGAMMFACNQVLVDGAVVACTAGEPLAALAEALPVVRRCFSASVARPVDLLIARVEPPLDRDLYQADKGIKNTEAAVRDGGVLIVEAACAEGIGIDHFLQTLRLAPTYASAIEHIERRGYRLGDHKAVRLRHLTDRRGVHVAVVTGGLEAELEEPLGMRLFADRAAAAAWAHDRLGAQCGVAVEVLDAGNITLTVD